MLAHHSDPFPKTTPDAICAAFGKLVAPGKTATVSYGEFVSRKKYAVLVARYRYERSCEITCGADRV